MRKNVCDGIIGTLLNIHGKSKDSKGSWLDLTEKGLGKELAPSDHGRKTYLPPTYFNLKKEEKRQLCQRLYDVQVPEGYSSNIRNLVSMDDLKLVGLKSHYCHTLIRHLLPVTILSLPNEIRYVVTRVCFFFNAICCKEVDITKLDGIQANIVKTLCHLERYFPPSFFHIWFI